MQLRLTGGNHLAAVVLAPVLALAAHAQKSGNAQLSELAALDARLSSATAAIAADEGQSALAKLDGWRFDSSTLAPEQRAQLLRSFTLSTLATGDAVSAAAYVSDLVGQFPDAAPTHVIGWRVALAAGDGKLATSMLGKLKANAVGERKEALAEQGRRIKHVGRLCPEAKLDISPSELVDLPGPRGVVVLDFWNPRKKPGEAQIAAMRARFSEYERTGARFYGIVAAGAQTDEARTFARAAGLAWPHVFESKAAGAPLTHKAFQATTSPVTIIVDADGIIRAASEPDDPALDYALRAVTAEAEGKFKSPDPRPAEGKPPVRGEIRATPAGATSGKTAGASGRGGQTEAEKPAGEPRHDEQAESKLREGRLALKTGQKRRAKEIFQEIVRDYPGTTAAKQAEEYLSSMP